MTKARFIAQIMGALLELATELYRRHKGDVAAAKAEIRRIPDYWTGTAEKRAKIDKELADLKAQGK
jgi:hypothetical protein